MLSRFYCHHCCSPSAVVGILCVQPFPSILTNPCILSVTCHSACRFQGLITSHGWTCCGRRAVGTAQLIACLTEKPGALLAQVQAPVRQGIFSPSRLSVQTHGIHTAPFVQLHASASACVLKISDTSSHTMVWTHENIVHADRNG